MPSSGSTTSFIASSTSSSDALFTAAAPPGAVPVSVASLMIASYTSQSLYGRVLERQPRQQGALDPVRVLRDPGEGDPVLEDRLVRDRLTPRVAHHRAELLHCGERVLDGAADQHLVEHARRGLADRAPQTLVRDVGHGAV